MGSRQWRNVLPGLYAIAILIGFVVAPVVGVAVCVIGGMLFGMLWSNLSRGARGRPPDRRG